MKFIKKLKIINFRLNFRSLKIRWVQIFPSHIRLSIRPDVIDIYTVPS